MTFVRPDDSRAQALLERMRTLYVLLDDARRRSPEYQQLIEQIRELAQEYGRVIDAHRGITRPEPKV